MKRILAVAAGMVLLCHPAVAEPGPFYLRGDVGIALGTASNESDTDPGSPIASLGPSTINGTLGTGMMFDAGVGYRAFPFLRLEGTVGYIPSLGFKGSFSTDPASTTQSSVSALVGLATANIDIAGFTGRLPGDIRPFVLGGIGVANVYNSPEYDFFNGAYVNTFSSATRTNLAWTVGAGIGIPVSERVTIDLTYRYLDLGERRSGPTLDSLGTLSPSTQDRADLKIHTIMIGLRYEL